MNNTALNLNYKEAHWLGRMNESIGGRVTEIDLQKKCGDKCISCPFNGLENSESMNYNKFKKLSDGILELKAKSGIDILTNNAISLFKITDPMRYKSMDGKKIITIADPITDMTTLHSKKIALTTSGWNPKDKIVQEAAEKIVEMHRKQTATILGYYSIKTVSETGIIKEYDTFLEKNPSGNIEDFIKNSKYVKNTISNLITFQEMNYRPQDYAEEISFKYEFQYIKDEDIQNEVFQKKYSKYSELVSKKTLDTLKIFMLNNGVKPLDAEYYRPFSGIGNAINAGIEPSKELIEAQKKYKNKMYTVTITSDGKLDIYYGGYSDIDKILVPKEAFELMAHKHRFWEPSKNKYEMLANLQGRQVIN